MDGLTEFPPGRAPIGLDLGDEFTSEGKRYRVKGVSSGCWIRAAPVIEPPPAPVLVATEEAPPLVEAAEPAQETNGPIGAAPVIEPTRDEQPVAVDLEYAQELVVGTAEVVEAVETIEAAELVDAEYGQRLS